MKNKKNSNSGSGITYFCRMFWLASTWFPQQKPSRFFPVAFGLLTKVYDS